MRTPWQKSMMRTGQSRACSQGPRGASARPLQLPARALRHATPLFFAAQGEYPHERSREPSGRGQDQELPAGRADARQLRHRRAAGPRAQPGQFLARTIYLSLDPYMRGRMSAGRVVREAGRAGPGRWSAATVGQVVRSDHPGYAEGDFVLGYWGWQEYGDLRRHGRAEARPGARARSRTPWACWACRA